MKVINFWSGPGCGKSTTAAGLFYNMKMMKLNVELVTEYAKDAVFERRQNLFEDQIYIFAKQHRRIDRLRGHGIDWVVTDSPFPLGLVYMPDVAYRETFTKLIFETFGMFENYNYLLSRKFDYNPVGRNQKDENEAKIFDDRVVKLLGTHNVPITQIDSGDVAIEYIINSLRLTH